MPRQLRSQAKMATGSPGDVPDPTMNAQTPTSQPTGQSSIKRKRAQTLTSTSPQSAEEPVSAPSECTVIVPPKRQRGHPPKSDIAPAASVAATLTPQKKPTSRKKPIPAAKKILIASRTADVPTQGTVLCPPYHDEKISLL